MDQIEKFKKSLADQGLDPGEILTDGAIHRFPTWGDKSGETSGAYPEYAITINEDNLVNQVAQLIRVFQRQRDRLADLMDGMQKIVSGG